VPILRELPFFNEREQRLAGVWHEPEVDAELVAVVAHGMLSSKNSAKHTMLCERLAAAGVAAFRFDFAGRGESEGSLAELTVSGQLADLRAAVATARAHGAGSVALIGSSLGGADSILVAADDAEIGALVTIATPARLPSTPRPAWQPLEDPERGECVGARFFVDAAGHDIPTAASRVRCPWLVLHGAADEVVPVDDAQLLSVSNPAAALEIHAEADHRFSARIAMAPEDTPTESCPKCGEPRLGFAWDCAKCGHLFDGTGPAADSGTAPAPADRPTPAVDRVAGEVPRPARVRDPAAGKKQAPARRVPQTSLQAWVDENLAVAITLALFAYLAVFAFVTTQLVASSADTLKISNQYRAVVGESPPADFQPMVSMTLVGRRLLVFGNPMQGQTLLLYHEGWLAGEPSATRLEAAPMRALRFFDIPFSEGEERRGKMLRLPVKIRILDVRMGDTNMRGYVATFTGPTGRPALLCLMGSPENVGKMARMMFKVG
jgi:predicted alpha/beta-hydrolase family hydrolase